MAVRQGVHKLVGVVALGQFYNDMQTIQRGRTDDEVEMATHILQFIFISDTGFRFPIAHFPTSSCPPSALFLIFWEGCDQMMKAGFR